MTSTECGHRFCYDCIEQRIRIGKRNACPLCEQPWGFDPYFTGKGAATQLTNHAPPCL